MFSFVAQTLNVSVEQVSDCGAHEFTLVMHFLMLFCRPEVRERALRGGIRKFVSSSCRCLVLYTEAIDVTTVRISWYHLVSPLLARGVRVPLNCHATIKNRPAVWKLFVPPPRRGGEQRIQGKLTRAKDFRCVAHNSETTSVFLKESLHGGFREKMDARPKSELRLFTTNWRWT